MNKKNLLIAVSLIICLSLSTFAFAKALKVNTVQAVSITNYVGTDIVRYDLGDTECFTNSTGLFCIKK